LYRRLGGPRSGSGRGGKEKNSQPLSGLEPPIIQPAGQRCTTELSWPEHKRRPHTQTHTAIIIKLYIYCKIINKLIQEAKKQHYNRLTAKSDYKMKTTWNIIKKGDSKK
jgi:hypothetical protein